MTEIGTVIYTRRTKNDALLYSHSDATDWVHGLVAALEAIAKESGTPYARIALDALDGSYPRSKSELRRLAIQRGKEPVPALCHAYDEEPHAEWCPMLTPPVRTHDPESTDTP